MLRVPDALVDFLTRIGGTLSRLQLYEKLTFKAPRLNRILISIFVKYLRLCLYLRDSFVKDGSHRRPWRTSLKFATEAFKGFMTEKIFQIDRDCKVAHQEAQLAVTNTILESTTSFQQALENLSDVEKGRQKAELKRQKLRDLEQSKRRFLEWLREVPTKDDLDDLRKEQVAGTCEWIENDKLISSWLSPDNPSPSILWISSGPGTGKSILAAHIINQLQNRHPTAFFFCKTNDQSKNTTIAILQNWIWQLVRDSPVLPESITTPSDEYQSPSISILERTILGLQQHLKPSYLVVDGLDECTDNVTRFLQSCRIISRVWSVLIVSRDVPDIREGLRDRSFGHKALTTRDNRMDIDTFMLHKTISKQDTEEDLKKVVGQGTAKLATNKSWQAMQKSIADVLSANAEGMFLWVRLVLDFLLTDATLESDIEEILGTIPSDLNGFYDKILAKMKANPSRWKFAQRALYWIIHGFRPLTVNELHAAIAFSIKSSKPIDGFEEILQASCGLLVRIDGASKKVAINHSTVKEYLLKAPSVFEAGIDGAEFAHAQMGRTCLTYLCIKLRSGVHVDKDIQQAERRVQAHLESTLNQLLEYSTVYWCQHIRRSLPQSKEWEPSLIQLLSSEDLTINWLQLFQYLHACKHSGTAETAQTLHVALHPSSDDNVAKSIFDSPELSSFKDHLGLADGNRFIRWDRFVGDAEDTSKIFPIILVAAQFDFFNTIKREIRRRVDIETQGYNGGTTLVWAARSGSLDSVRYLLRAGAIKNDPSLSNQKTALAKAIDLEDHIIAEPGTYPVVQLLLEAEVDPYLSHHRPWNILNVLINGNNTDGDGEISTVKLLLKYGPDLWKHDHRRFGTVLHHAVLKDKPRIAGAILEEIRAQNPENAANLLRQLLHGENALHFALQNNAHMVPFLLDQGADVSIPDSKGALPIQSAAQQDLGSAIRALQGRGSNVGVKGSWNETPLVIALGTQSMDAASALLDMGANPQQVPESLLLLPRTTTLDSRIQALKPTGTPWPLSVRDVFQICFRVREKYFLPIPVTARIFDMAEIWVRSSVTKSNLETYDQNTVRKTYLRSAPIIGRNTQPVQKITFTITSHDQGYATVNGSHTWFEGCQLASGGSRKVLSWPIVYNRPANPKWHTYRITWSRPEHEFLKVVKSGDRISVIACALYQAWVNYVKDMRIDIYTSILRRHYSREELSDIWNIPFDESGQGTELFEKTAPKSILPTAGTQVSKRPKVRILSADYGTVDVTRILSDLVIDDQFLQLDTNSLDTHFTDTFPGAGKALTIIYQFNDGEPQVFLTTQNRGPLFLDLATAGWKITSFAKPPGATVQILAVFYGDKFIRKEAVYRSMYTAIAQKEELLVSNEFLGHTWRGNRKACVVFYRGEDGVVGRKAAKEGERLKFEL